MTIVLTVEQVTLGTGSITGIRQRPFDSRGADTAGAMMTKDSEAEAAHRMVPFAPLSVLELIQCLGLHDVMHLDIGGATKSYT